MSDLEKMGAERESRRRAADAHRPSRYGAAVDRYLGAVGYPVDARHAPLRRPAGLPAHGTVLVGADGSPAGYSAVDHAAIEAELRGWDLRIVHARSRGRDGGAGLLERLSERVRAGSPTVPVQCRLVTGPAVPLLLAEARDAGLVVVGHRHGSAGAAFGWSVGDRVAAAHPGTVLVVRVPGWLPGTGSGRRPIVAGVDRPGRITPVVRFALDEARVRGDDVVLLHARPDAAPGGWTEVVDGVRVDHRTVDTDPVRALTEFSSRAAAVVVGRRPSGAHPATLLGSVSRAMVRAACCPVFLVDRTAGRPG